MCITPTIKERGEQRKECTGVREQLKERGDGQYESSKGEQLGGIRKRVEDVQGEERLNLLFERKTGRGESINVRPEVGGERGTPRESLLYPGKEEH